MARILFVEDESRGINPYFHCLEPKGISCVAAPNAEEAVAQLQREHFDLLSLDVMFDPGRAFAGEVNPRRSGLHLLELIRGAQIPNCDPQLKVVVLTAVGNAEVEERMRQLGVVDYLKKPVSFDKVIGTYLDTLKT
jgi:CheY-like chemotaxis protein